MLNSRKIGRLAVGVRRGAGGMVGKRSRPGPGRLGGFGWGLGYQTPASVTFLNDHAAARVGSVAARQPQNLRDRF